MKIRKGMSMAITIVVVIIVLVFVAVIVIGLTQGKLIGGIGFFQGRADRAQCLSNKDMFCQDNPTGYWNSTELSIRNQTCDKILKKTKEPIYNCTAGRLKHPKKWTTNCPGICGVIEQ